MGLIGGEYLDDPVEDAGLCLLTSLIVEARGDDLLVFLGLGVLEPAQQVLREEGALLVVAGTVAGAQPAVGLEVRGDLILKGEFLVQAGRAHVSSLMSSSSCSAAGRCVAVTSIWPVTAAVMSAARRSLARVMARVISCVDF